MGFAATGLLLPSLSIAQNSPTVVIVSRERMLRDVEAAKILADTERRFAASLQEQIDRANDTFASEEAEIAEMRGSVSSSELSERITDFDQRMRRWRRTAQERAGELQRGFQESRAQIVAFLPQVLEQLRRETGAHVVVNADQVLAADPALDATARAVALFNDIAPPPVIPEINLDLPPVSPDDNTGTQAPAVEQ